MMPNLRKAIQDPKKAFFVLVSNIYNLFRDISPSEKNSVMPYMKELDEIKSRSAKTRNDISGHLVRLFVESFEAKPKLIVELGVRGGESTFVLERVARHFDARLVSVDLDDCSGISSYEKWSFIRGDDIKFAMEFPKWCKKHGISASIDILFIDTSHLFEHTCLEIKSWFPHLSDKAKVFFHDTNLRRLYFREDGSMGAGWNNKRGVIRAIEKYFNAKFNEKEEFTDILKGFIIRHYPKCSGMTILQRFDA